MDVPQQWPCPGCGSIVVLPVDELATVRTEGAPDLDRLAQALCGCFVFSMPPVSLGRLLAAVLRADEEEAPA